MKSRILTEIERIAGDRLPPEMRDELAECIVKIMKDINEAKALDAMETLKDKIVNNKEPNGTDKKSAK